MGIISAHWGPTACGFCRRFVKKHPSIRQTHVTGACWGWTGELGVPARGRGATGTSAQAGGSPSGAHHGKLVGPWNLPYVFPFKGPLFPGAGEPDTLKALPPWSSLAWRSELVKWQGLARQAIFLALGRRLSPKQEVF